jgi:translocation and assembly module TamB
MVLGVASLGLRYGPNTLSGRSVIERQLNGLKIARFGRLQVEGLGGDLWREASVRRLALADSQGVWIEGRNLTLRWRPQALMARRFHAEAITAGSLQVLRQPVLTVPMKHQPMLISVQLDSVLARVETLPAISTRRGLFDFGGRLTVERRGGLKGRLVARSQLHQGDFADIIFDLGGDKAVTIDARAAEVEGGALAGLLGLPADEAFHLNLQARGKPQDGQFDLSVYSGTSTPAEAHGLWTRNGGSAKGFARLDASRLTRGLKATLGPEVRFDVTGEKGKGDYVNLDARLDTEALSLTATGAIDPGKGFTGPDGLVVSARTTALARLTQRAVGGVANFKGLLKGDSSKASLAGDVSGSNLTAAGLGLGRLAGPVKMTLDRGEVGLMATLTGAGGSGSGLPAALLGPRPFARFEAARLSDGRLLLRKIQARGQGLVVEASGGRGLLGGLSFQGTAEFSNLQAARLGGRGMVKGKWSADQGGVDRPWNATLDATGSGLALGWSELDRLLGPAPRLRAKASLQGGALRVSEARLDGLRSSARASGVVDGVRGLGLKLDWAAEGPFRAGPIEISGKAAGDGSISGTLAAPRADLTAVFDAIDLPRLPLANARATLSFLRRPAGGDGTFSLAAESQHGPARLRADFAFAPGGLDLSGLDADAGGIAARGKVSLRRGRPSSADLIIAAGPGVLLSSGSVRGDVRIVEGPDGPLATMSLKAVNAAPRDAPGLLLADATITANGPLERLPLRIQAKGEGGSGDWSIDARGILTEGPKNSGWGLGLDGSGRLGRASIRTVDTARLTFGGESSEAHLKLTAARGVGAQAAAGTVILDASMTASGANVTADIAGLPIAIFNDDLAGRLDGKLALSGQGKVLSGEMDANLSNVRARGSGKTLTLDGRVKAVLLDQYLTVLANLTSAQGLKANASLVLAAETSAAPLRLAIDRSRPVKGMFDADGEIKPLWDLLMGGERSVSGRVQASGSLGGTLADPRLLGQMQLQGGAFQDGPTGLKLKDVAVAATFADQAIDVTRAVANDAGGGSLSGAGRISLQRETASSFRLDLTRFQVIDNDIATATASGQTTITRSADGNVKLSGALRIDRAQIAADPLGYTGVTPMDVVEINKPPVVGRRAAQDAARKQGPVANLDVTLKAARGIFVEGRGLNVELSMDAVVGGTTANPMLSGTARVVRGEYDFAGKRFEFDETGDIQLSTDPRKVRLNLTATRSDPSLTAKVEVRGTAARPEITLSSTPVLPQDEVLSRILFGASAAQLSPLEAAQLASALAALAGGGGFDVIGGLRNLAGLDRLTFGGGGDAGMTVAGGKYLTDDVYLELIGGGREGTAAQVEWRVRRNLSIVSRIAGQGDAKLSVRWRRDY